jgi:DNA mismatch repair protein PMS2
LLGELLDAIFSVGVRLNLMDMVGKRENTLLATQLNTTSLQQTVSSVLGSKFLSTVMPITIDLADALPHAPSGGEWKVEGLVSKSPNENVVAGAKTGQQYFSINGRPVELPKIARLLGDVWRSMGGKKKPSCVLTLW